MKNICLIFTFICCTTAIFCQSEYLSKRYNFGYLATVFTGIYPTDSCIYVKGVMTDSFYREGSFLCKFDLDGNVNWRTEMADSNMIINTWFTRLSVNNNGNLIVSGSFLDTITIHAYISEFDTAGNQLQTASFISPYSPEKSHIIPLEWIQTEDEGYLLAGNLTVSTLERKSIFLARVSKDFEVEWLKQFGTTTLREGVGAMCLDEQKNIIIGGSLVTNPFFANSIFQKYIFETDSSGNEINWEWQYPPTGDNNNKGFIVEDMLLLEDNSIIGGSAVSREFPGGGGMANNSYYASIFKLAPDHITVLWETLMGNGCYHYASNEIIRVLPANDGDGFIGLGNMLSPPTNLGGQVMGIIGKVAENGDSLWMRVLQFNSDTMQNGYDSQMHEIQPAPGGGYWIAAEVTRPEADSTIAWQQGWLLKVDNYGCLVPNCQLTDNNADLDWTGGRLLLYPNPAKGYIAVYHNGYTYSKGIFRIVDATGKVKKVWKAALDDLTTVCDLPEYTQGVYFLQYIEDGKPIINKEFVITH